MQYYTFQTVSPLFENLELGLITPETFYDEFRNVLKLHLQMKKYEMPGMLC